MGLWKEARAKKLLPLVIQAAAWVKSRKDLDQETSQRWSGGSWTSEFPWCFLSFVGTFGHLFSSVLAHAIWISSVSFNMPRMPRSGNHTTDCNIKKSIIFRIGGNRIRPAF